MSEKFSSLKITVTFSLGMCQTVSPDFKRIKSLRLEDSNMYLQCIYIIIFSFMIGSKKIYPIYLNLSCNTHTLKASCHSKLVTKKSIFL